MPTIKKKGKYVSKDPSVSKYFNVSKTPIVERLEAFERESPFTALLGINQLPAGQSPGVCDCPPVLAA